MVFRAVFTEGCKIRRMEEFPHLVFRFWSCFAKQKIYYPWLKLIKNPFQSGVFPDVLKISKVNPVYKGSSPV